MKSMKRVFDALCWKYKCFDLDHLENDEWVAEFRFQKDDIYDLPGTLQSSDEIVCYN